MMDFAPCPRAAPSWGRRPGQRRTAEARHVILSVMKPSYLSPSCPQPSVHSLVVPAVPIFQRRRLRLQRSQHWLQVARLVSNRTCSFLWMATSTPPKSLYSAPTALPSRSSPLFLRPVHLMWGDMKGGRFTALVEMLISLMSAGRLHVKAQETLWKVELMFRGPLMGLLTSLDHWL